jgi:hypothetical protein
MSKPSVSLVAEQGIIAASLGVIENVWAQRFAQYKKQYDAAFLDVSGKLTAAGKSHDKALIAMATTIAGLALKPLGVYGAIASVALAGFSELAKGAVPPNPASKLGEETPTSYAATLEGTAARMFEPLTRASLAFAIMANKQKTMGYDEYLSAKSLLLSSPIWFPPAKREDGLVKIRIEAALWAAYFHGLSRAGYESHQLRYLDDIVAYLMDEALVPEKDSKGWENYPKPITQGGPGDWLKFVRVTHPYWESRMHHARDEGWLMPLPEVPENAQVKRSVNWTVPRTYTFKAPTKSGKASIRIESVEMSLRPMLDWPDIPALRQARP